MVNKTHNGKNKDFNKSVSNCLQKCDLFLEYKKQNTNSIPIYKDEDEYQNSFQDVFAFSKDITPSKKKSINTIIFNTNNADGIFSAYVAIKFLKENNIENIKVIQGKPASGNSVNSRLKYIENDIKNKNVLIVDIAYSKVNLNYMAKLAKSIIVIDDHPSKNRNLTEGLNENIKYFVGDKHSAVGYTWKFFFPTKKVPMYIQYIDNDDRKLFLPYIIHNTTFRDFMNYRFIHSPYLHFKDESDFNKLDELIENIDIDFMNVVGHYYFEVTNNIKDQVAINAQKRYFQGHPVYVLNYNDPVLYKMVARQMITNAEKKGDNIHFAVLWGFEYTTNLYKVFMSEKHSGTPKYNLKQIAEKLGRVGGTKRGGGGAVYIGNFYWPKNNKMDIWNLFTDKPTYL